MRLHFIGAVVVVLVTAASADASPAIQSGMILPSVKISDNCSGQLVSSKRDVESGEVSTFILTAKHCLASVKSGETIPISFPQYDIATRLVGELVYYGSVAAKDPKGDLALIRLHDKQTYFKNTVTVDDGKNPVQLGDDCWAAGFPKAWALTITRGIIGPLERQDFDGPDGEIEYRRASAQVAGGSSGGGLYRLIDGAYTLIGVTTGRASSDAFIAMWTPLDAIQTFLAKWVKP